MGAGAAASLIGDHSHVATGTTEYLTDAVPFIWSSPIWFPLLVAFATVSLAELRMRAPRTLVTPRQGVAGVAAVCGVLAGIVGPIVEAVIAGAGVFRYADDSDSLFGVAPWLPALYFAFGVVVAVLDEIAAKDREPSVRSSASGTPAQR